MITWTRATSLPDKRPVWVNMGNLFSMMVVIPAAGPSFTRLWAGSTTAVLLPGGGPNYDKSDPCPLPLCVDVVETPEQLLCAVYGSLPGEGQ